LNRIAQLYAVEAEARDFSTEGRKQQRAEKSVPILDALHGWLQQTRLRTAPNAATAKAIDYSLKRWVALTRYAETGDLPIDNNPVENAIRPIALGKKNWLFAGSEACRSASCGDSNSAWHGQTQRTRPRRLVKRHPGKTPHLAQQPHRRIAAIQ
jgi:hypothetical protein